MRGNHAKTLELIGTTIAITQASNSALMGLSGVVVDETKHTFVIETKDKKKKTVMKKNITFRMVGHGKTFLVKGDILIAKPHERIKQR